MCIRDSHRRAQDGRRVGEAALSRRKLQEGPDRGDSQICFGDAPPGEGTVEKTGRHGILRREFFIYRQREDVYKRQIQGCGLPRIC